MNCVYPTKKPDTAQKPPSMQNIGDRLIRLESLVCRIAEIVESKAVSSVMTETPIQHLRDKLSNSSTWDILLNKSDMDLLQELTFFVLFGFPSS